LIFKIAAAQNNLGRLAAFPKRSLHDNIFMYARSAISMLQEASDERPFLLATLPPSQRQIRVAIVVVVTLLVAFGATAPFASTQLQRVDAFIPTLESACVVNDLITSALLFAQFSIMRRWALLVLAIGFLFTSLIVIPHALTFPGAFTPTGFLGAGVQSTVWLYIFWKVGLPLAVIVYVPLKDADGRTGTSERSPRVVILWSIAIVIATVCGLTWVATAGERLLPKIFLIAFMQAKLSLR